MENNKENLIEWNEKNLLRLFDLVRIYGTSRIDKIAEVFGSTRSKLENIKFRYNDKYHHDACIKNIFKTDEY